MRFSLIAVFIITIAQISVAQSTARRADDGWRFIGPRDIAVETIVSDPSDARRVYCISGRNGLYRSDDGGETWQPLSPLVPHTTKVAGVPTDLWPSNLRIAVTPDGTLYMVGGWLYASADHGKTWRKLAWFGNVPVSLAAVTRDILVALTPDGVSRSTDRGQSWNAVRPQRSYGGGLVAVHPRDRNLIFAAPSLEKPDGTILRSRDAGLTWEMVSDRRITDVCAMALDPTDPRKLYCTANEGLMRSTDAGHSWSMLQSVGRFSISQQALAVDPASPSTIYAQTVDGIAVSHDAGNTWTNLTDPRLTGRRQSAISASPSGALLIARPSAVLRSTDHGRTWRDASQGFRTARVTSVAPDYSMPGGLYAEQSTGQVGLVRSSDGGRTWRFVHYAYGRVATSPREPKTVVVAGSYAISVSRDCGTTWKEYHLPKSVVNPVYAIDPNRPERIALGSQKQVLTTDDAGASWSSSDVPFGGSAWASSAVSPSRSTAWVSAVAVSPADGALLAGFRESILRDIPWGNPRSHAVRTLALPTCRSGDFGKTWRALSASEKGPIKTITALAVDPLDPRTIYAGGSQGDTWSTFLKSTDGGLTWHCHQDSPVEQDINSIAIDPLNTERIYIGTAVDGIYISADGGESWRKCNEGIQVEQGAYYSAESLLIDPRDRSHIYASTTVGLYERRWKAGM